MPGSSTVGLHVRPVHARDRDAWLRMRSALWPDGALDHAREIDAWLAGDPRPVFPGGQGAVLVADTGEEVGAFVEVALRSVADGCASSPVGYLEGIWVDPGCRRRGVARRLVEAAEAWARERGCREMGSDALLENAVSRAWHAALGYGEVDRHVTFRKDLA